MSASKASGNGSNTANQYTYSLTPLSYALPILHAAKHTSSTVIGVFLSPIPSTSTSTATASSNELVITDAVPLIHVHTALSPLAEAGLSLIEEYARSRNQRIVGVYTARAPVSSYGDGDKGGTSSGLGRSAERILGALRESFDGAFGLVIDNDQLGAAAQAYIPYLSSASSSNGSFSPLPPSSIAAPNPDGSRGTQGPFSIPSSDLPGQVISTIRTQKVHRDVIDFDESLDHPSADWLENKAAKASIAKCFS